MMLARIAVISLVSLLALMGASQAQIPCDEIDASPLDTVTVVQTTGRPDSTVDVPIHFVNNLCVASFQAYLEFDTTFIKPIVDAVDTLIDTTVYWENCRDTVIDDTPAVVCDSVGWSEDTLIMTYYEHSMLPRFYDTLTYLSVVAEFDFPPAPTTSLQRLKILALPKRFDTIGTAVDSGAGNIMTIPFKIDPTAPHNTTVPIGFYSVTIYDTTVWPHQQIGCQYSQYTDTTGAINIRFTEAAGSVTVDTAYVPPQLPVIHVFMANPDTIMEGESTYLVWNVSNADEVVISGVGTFTNLHDSVSVGPLSATTFYSLTATNSEGEAYAQTKVTVIPYVENNRPVFTQPTQTSYEIDQGQTLTFQVTATDADNDEITLTASSLPGNATFGPTNPVIGVGSVTGNFSFTPDYTQKDMYQVTFTADDGKAGGTRQLTVSIQVNELKYDRLFTTSAEGQLPVGGLAGTREILLPINLITSQTVYGVQFDFFYDEEYFDVDSFITTPRTENYVIYENIGAIPGEIRVVTFGVANEPIVTDTASTAILYAVMSIDTGASPGDYPILMEDGWESVDPDPNYPSLPLVTDAGIAQVDRLGDVNLDKRVDVADAVNIVGYILGNFGLNPRQFAAADVVTDTTVNVLDLVGIINLIYGIPPSPVAGQYAGTEMAIVSLDYADLYVGSSDVMVVRSELPEQIAGVQLEIRYDPSVVTFGNPTLAADADKLVLSSKDNGHGKLVILLYFKNPVRTEDLIQVGEADLVNIPIVAQSNIEFGNDSQMRLSKALLSTASAQAVRVEGMDLPLPSTFILHQNYPNPFNPTTTIEFSLGGASDGSLTQHVTLDIYNILGQHVKALLDEDIVPGNYQVEWDATNSSGQRIATGLYLYKLQVGQESKSKKMLFLK